MKKVSEKEQGKNWVKRVVMRSDGQMLLQGEGIVLHQLTPLTFEKTS